MSPTLTFAWQENDQWVYEIKYDGFRCLLFFDEEKIELISKNGRLLNEQFPEIVEFFAAHQKDFIPYLPLTLDGELAILENPYKANFQQIQKRGRMKSQAAIAAHRKQHKAAYLAFDLLRYQGSDVTSQAYIKRKEILRQIIEQLKVADMRFQYINYERSFQKAKEIMELYHCEGIIAKKLDSKWEYGKTKSWMKLKNYRQITCFITGYDRKNGYFSVGVYDKQNSVQAIGLFKHGLLEDERQVLITTIKQHGSIQENEFISIDPSICVELKCLELYEHELREPYFHAFRFDLKPEDCTLEKLQKDLFPLPKHVMFTNKDKLLWETEQIQKESYLQYLHRIAPYMLPFLQERPLTVIRFPNGILNEAFYQKNCPEYAPDFVKTIYIDDIHYIVCNDITTLLWLGNQGAIEFHIPFQKGYDNEPAEIIIDLDPPSIHEFPLAIYAAQMIKEVCDSLSLKTFVKTSGRKGMQVLIPIPERTFPYQETHLFTSFIANYLVSKEPKFFTTERMKAKRGNKLYVDYVQHGQGKTIIAPYSARAVEGALVSTPLYWDEVTDELLPNEFTIRSLPERLKEKGCPLKTYEQARNNQPLDAIISFLKEKLVK